MLLMKTDILLTMTPVVNIMRKKVLLSVVLFFAFIGLFAVAPVGVSEVITPQAYAYDKSDCADIQNKPNDCKIISDYLNPAIKLLAAIAGIAAIIGITIGGIQYSASGGDPQQVAKGKGLIIKALTGFVAFLFLASFVQFLSPGGVADKPGSMPSPSAAKCARGNGFLGLKPWYVYLPPDRFDQDGESCAITNFKALPKTGMSDIVPVALAILETLLRIAGLIAVAFVVVGGVKYVTSQGEPSATAQAKDTIINAIIGVVIVLIASGVIVFIGNQLAK